MSTATPLSFAQLLADVVTTPGIISSAYRAFHNYSVGNMIAAADQLMARGIEIGPIASFMSWKDKGRSVRKGEKAIFLCMPITCKGTKESDDGSEQQFTFSRFVWKPHWFALAQTEGAEYAPEMVSPEWDAATALAGLGITEVPFDLTNGNVQGFARGQCIAINPVAALPHKTRFHELAHVVLGHTAESVMSDCEQTPRDIREVEAESVAFILCQILGLPGAAESRGYVQGWLQGQEVTEKSAQRIYRAADRILKAGKPSQAAA